MSGVDRPGQVVGIVADDLTGANDCVVQFARTGWRSRLALTEALPAPDAGTALAVVTDTRPMPHEPASAVTREVVRRLAAAGAGRIYLKIDSTMRGSVAGQVAGALDAWRVDHPQAFAVVCPAYPAMGRTVVDGRLLVSGTPVAQTGLGRDPVTPVGTSEMGELLPGSGYVAPDVAADDLAAAIAAAARSSVTRTVVVEARTDADLDTLADAVDRLGPDALPVGSAGLAIALARAWGSLGNLPATTERPGTAVRAQRVLVVLSSLNAVSREQADVLVRDLPANEVRVLTVEPGPHAADPDTAVAWLDERIGEAAEPRTTVLRSPDEPWGTATPDNDRADLVAGTLAAVAYALVSRIQPHALVLTGGDGARAVLGRLGARAVRVAGAIAEGVPYGFVEGGVADGVMVVTKAGGFGPPRVLAEVVSALRAGSVAPALEGVDR